MQAYAEASTSSSMPTRKKSRSSIAIRSICPKSPKLASRQRRRSWLLDLTAMALIEDPNSASSPYGPDRRGRWTVMAAARKPYPAMCSRIALHALRSRQDHTFAEKLLSGMRKSSRHVERAAGARKSSVVRHHSRGQGSTLPPASARRSVPYAAGLMSGSCLLSACPSRVGL